VTLADRAAAYAQAFAKFPASHLRVVLESGGDCLYGTWLIGNDYKNSSRYYGAYPHGYLDRVRALFPDVPDVTGARVMHIFSGSLGPGNYERVDQLQEAEIRASVTDLPNIVLNWRPVLILADPPYSQDDAKKYGTLMIDRGDVFRSLARITDPGAHVVWLDTVWPMHRKAEWRTVGRICLVRSTNHRVRLISIFERQAA
jgi:hypothetical protein